MNQPKSITIGGMKFEPITSPGPCSICGEPADGLMFVGQAGKEWQLCGSEVCWTNVHREADDLEKTGNR